MRDTLFTAAFLNTAESSELERIIVGYNYLGRSGEAFGRVQWSIDSYFITIAYNPWRTFAYPPVKPVC